MASGLSDLLSDGALESRRQAVISTIRQVATATGVANAHDADGWAAHDDATLLAQGRASALGGRMLAMYAVPSLDGLSERFAAGGDFLDVGVGVAEMAAAFCEAMPRSRAVGIDVLAAKHWISLVRRSTPGCRAALEEKNPTGPGAVR